MVKDIDSSARIIIAEASRRFGSQMKASLEPWIFLDIPPDDPSYSLRDDDFIKLELS